MQHDGRDDQAADVQKPLINLKPPNVEEAEMLKTYRGTQESIFGMMAGIGAGSFLWTQVPHSRRTLAGMSTLMGALVGSVCGQFYGTRNNIRNAIESGSFEAEFPEGKWKELILASVTDRPINYDKIARLEEAQKPPVVEPVPAAVHQYQSYNDLREMDLHHTQEPPINLQPPGEVTLVPTIPDIHQDLPPVPSVTGTIRDDNSAPPPASKPKRYNQYGDEISH